MLASAALISEKRASDACLKSETARVGTIRLPCRSNSVRPSFLFQLPYALADGAMRHVQFARRLGVAAVAAGHLEYPQGLQRWEERHSSIVRSANNSCQILSFDPSRCRE